MKQYKPLLTSLILVLALVLAGFSSHVAQAATTETLKYEGTITEVTDGGAPFTFVTEDGYEVTVGIGDGTYSVDVVDEEGEQVESYAVSAPEGFEFSELAADDTFELTAEYDEENEVWQFTELKVQNQEQERELLEEQNREREDDGYFCSEDAEDHPVAVAIAETYDTSSDEVISMFCDGQGEEGSARTGFGQIMLAYQTAEETEGSAKDILDQRLSGEGWGQIWQGMDLIGKPDNPGNADDAGNKPEEPGNGHKPEGVGPDDVGPPEGVNPPGHSNKPAQAGPNK